MAFDLSSAKPITSGGFDLSTAKAIAVHEQEIPQQVPSSPPESGIVQQTLEQYSKPLPHRSFTDKEYWTENVPQSLGRIVPQAITGIVGLPYNAAKKFTDPIANALSGGDLGQAASDFFYAPKNAATEFANALAYTTGAPVGAYGIKEMKKAWDDPAASALAVIPLTVPIVKGAGAAIPQPVNLTKRSLKFSPGVEPELQTRVAETVLKNDASTTTKSYAEFKQKIRDLNNSVSEMIAPVAGEKINMNPEAWVTEILNKAELSGKRSETIGQINKYLEEFKTDHPEATVGEAQKLKISLNKLLESYEKSRQAGHTMENAGEEMAMRAIANGLRSEIERFAPETKEANSQIHEMIVAKPFLKSAANKAESQPYVTGRDMIAGAVGSFINPALGAGAMIASRVARDPRVQSKLAVAMDGMKEWTGKLRELTSEKEAAKIVADIEPIVAPDAIRETTNQLSPKFESVPAEVNSFERLFQIAQSPQGKQLLLERLGREERNSKLVQELLAVPDAASPPINYPLVPVPGVKVYHVGKNKMNPLGQ